MEDWKLLKEELPTESGEYEVINNSNCNGGWGLCYYDTEKGWDIPDMIASFYKIIKWRQKRRE